MATSPLSPKGEIYVSVQGGDHAGIQVYSARGQYLRNVPGAPTDLHGFIIARGRTASPISSASAGWRSRSCRSRWMAERS